MDIPAPDAFVAPTHWMPPAAGGRPVEVLVIEDNIGFAYYIRDALSHRMDGRFRVHEAHSLADGLNLLAETRVDIILLDLGLPDSTRIATFDKVHSRFPHIPVIVLTVLDEDELAFHAVRGGAQDYLVKNRTDKDLLVRSIRYAMERKRSENAVHDLSARLLDLQEAERRRIARDLHDTTAQTLAALCMNLSTLNRAAGGLPAGAQSVLSESAALASQCSRELRTTAYLLHPPLLDELGLAGAVREYCDGFAERSGLRVDLEIPPDLPALPREAATTFFRIMQECLANIHRHSGSPTASIRFRRDDRGIRMEVTDQGRGIPEHILRPPEDAPARLGVGIAGMRERIRQLGGVLELANHTRGATVSALLPHTGDSA